MKANNIEELFGTLQQSVVASWRKHLKTDKYSKHEALDEFYKEMPELVDSLIEDWMGINGKVEEYKNILDGSSKMTAIEYLEKLQEIVKNSRSLMNGETELEGDMDDIQSQIDSTLYKLKELKENIKNMISLKDFINESLINESISKSKAKSILKDAIEDDGSLVSISSVIGWMDWNKNYNLEEFINMVMDINDDLDEDIIEHRYYPIWQALKALGKNEAKKYIESIADEDDEYFDALEDLK